LLPKIDSEKLAAIDEQAKQQRREEGAGRHFLVTEINGLDFWDSQIVCSGEEALNICIRII